MRKQDILRLAGICLLMFEFAGLHACRCNGESSISASIVRSDAVFSGVVLSISNTTNLDSLGIEIVQANQNREQTILMVPTSVVMIKVERLYKGIAVSDTLTVLTPAYSAACGYAFQVGGKYIIYGTQEDALASIRGVTRRAVDGCTYWTHQCTRTMPFLPGEEKGILKELE